jgi:hypothetical protein
MELFRRLIVPIVCRLLAEPLVLNIFIAFSR